MNSVWCFQRGSLCVKLTSAARASWRLATQGADVRQHNVQGMARSSPIISLHKLFRTSASSWHSGCIKYAHGSKQQYVSTLLSSQFLSLHTVQNWESMTVCIFQIGRWSAPVSRERLFQNKKFPVPRLSSNCLNFSSLPVYLLCSSIQLPRLIANFYTVATLAAR